MPVAGFNILDYITEIVDILLVTYVIYKIIMLIRGTKAVQLLKGITVIIAAWFFSSFFELNTLHWILERVVLYGLLAIIIIFQPELRRALEQLGRGRLFSRGSVEEEQTLHVVESAVKATSYMGKRRIGALISIERETGLNDYVETGIPIQARITSELLINLFIPNTPLHDGAVIMKGDQILAAACYLPLSESPFISKELGTRHRAALGISEVTDSVTIVVSEETGGVSLTKNGELHRNLSEDALRELLIAELRPATTKSPASNRWNWRGKKNG
ncbi:diadenylate cyclase CdaA [Pseudalkalibacillus caeni]|uniref:Diadenylate cyclase n=1 Tax=Exobacillus caeni TaxID=2574798 RepID=A0A5R9F535_9BACL|nr:diadenylate cyclase CdaA [Pseudalkalibacillus caeni]TLS34935.1 TIGR00159 family protein [Pseudalkalibacillus caeni]